MNINMNRRDRYLNRRKNKNRKIIKMKNKLSLFQGLINAFRIFKRDVTAIFRSWVTMVIIIALIILPALYAWFNIKACWDPYGNTSSLSVAVVNLDKGAMYRDVKVTAGADIVKQLENNKKIGWKFVSKIDAENGVKYGKYYASITIPTEFSKNLLSVVTDDVPTKATMVYSVNEKINAIAEKITDKGSSSLQDEVTRAFIETASDKVMSILNQFGVEMENNKPIIKNMTDTIIDLDNKMPDIGNDINNAYNASVILQNYISNLQEDIPLINDTLDKTENIAKTNSDNLKQLQNSLKAVDTSLKNNRAIIKSNADSTKLLLTDTKNFVPLDFSGTNQILSTINSSVDNSIKKIDSNIKLLQTIKDELNNNKNPVNNPNNNTIMVIDRMISDLTNIRNDLQNQQNNINKTVDSINSNVATAQKLLPNAINTALDNADKAVNNMDNIVNDFNNNTEPALEKTMESFVGISDNTVSLLQASKDNLAILNDLLSASSYSAGESGKIFKNIDDKFPQFQKDFHSNVQKLKALNDDKRYDEIVRILKKNAKDESEFLAEPVKLQENKLYAIPNYGSAMSPFYTTLAIWVGSFIIMALLAAEVNNFEDGTILKPLEKYFGRYIIICIMALLQALVVTLGDIFILKVYVISPLIFVLFSMYVALVFSIIIYTSVSVLGNVGKAIIMILLVLQVSASGGTFPIELTPSFFQYINPMLPFKYAISGMRETVAGILPEALIFNVMILSVYLVIALLMGIFLKGLLNRILHQFVKQFKESGLVGE